MRPSLIKRGGGSGGQTRAAQHTRALPASPIGPIFQAPPSSHAHQTALSTIRNGLRDCDYSSQPSPSLAAEDRVTLKSGHVGYLSSAHYTAQCRSQCAQLPVGLPSPTLLAISDLTFLWLSSRGAHAGPDVPAFRHVGPRLGRKHLYSLSYLVLLFLDLS